MKNLAILYQSSNEFAFMVGTSLTSLLENASDNLEYNVFILTPDMTIENREKFEKLISSYPQIHMKLTFLDATYCQEEILKWNVPEHRGAYITYFKLLLDHYFKDTDIKSILHIGGDTLVTGSLEELCDFDFHGNPIAMNWSTKEYERHFPLNYKYCIAEMVFFNLEEWRKHNCEERIRRHFSEIGEIYGSKDQGILNMEFQFEFQQLPLKYNIYGFTFYFSLKNKMRFNNAPVITKQEVIEAYEKPEIIHIPRTFLYRPHEKGSKEPLKEMWWNYNKKSPWNDIEPVEPYPPLGTKELFMRRVYLMLPAFLAEPFYILCRHGYEFMHAMQFRPLPMEKRSIGYTNKKDGEEK